MSRGRKIALFGCGVPVALVVLAVGVCAIIGATYPKDHTFSKALKVRKTPEEVWAVVTDFPGQASWNPIVKGARRLADREGREVWEEESTEGPPMILETLEAVPPGKLVRSIADTKAAFSGTWTWEIEPADGGCRVRVTERGTVPNPLFRFMVRVVGPERYVTMYLEGLAKKLGEPPVFE
jgi:uncharacterized protein YndB with AHSA1/START domain